MAGTKTKENKMYSGVIDSAMKLGTSFAPFKAKSKKAVDVGQYQNLSSIAGNYRTPSSFKQLGALTTPYGGSTKYEGKHPGVDLANKIGTPIPSFTGGTVVGVESGFRKGDKGFGNSVIVRDAQGNMVRYSHLNNAYVKVGQQVKPGAIIGAMGNTGSTYSTSGGTGSHLDLRIKDARGNYIDPNKYLS